MGVQGQQKLQEMNKRTITSPYHIAILDFLDKHMTHCIQGFFVPYGVIYMNTLQDFGFHADFITSNTYIYVDLKSKRYYSNPISEEGGLSAIVFDLNEMVTFLKRELHKYE